MAEPPEWILVDIRRIFACSFRTLSFSPYCITSRCTLHRWIILHTFSAADSRAETSHECYNDMLNFGTVLEHRYQGLGAWETHGVKHGKRSEQHVELHTNMFIREGPTFGAVCKKGPIFGANSYLGKNRKKGRERERTSKRERCLKEIVLLSLEALDATTSTRKEIKLKRRTHSFQTEMNVTESGSGC